MKLLSYYYASFSYRRGMAALYQRTKNAFIYDVVRVYISIANGIKHEEMHILIQAFPIAVSDRRSRNSSERTHEILLLQLAVDLILHKVTTITSVTY